MGSKSKRRKSRKKRKQRIDARPIVPTDPHELVATAQIEAVMSVMAEFVDAEDPVAAVTDALAGAVADFSSALAGVAPARLVEVARLACLPWSPEGDAGAAPADSAAARAEIIALIAVASSPQLASTAPDGRHEAAGGPQPVTNLVHGTLVPSVDRLFHLAQVREMLSADPTDPLGFIAANMRGAQIWIRNSSYPDRVEELYLRLFADPVVHDALVDELGFGAPQALEVLRRLHELQIDRLNVRMHDMRAAAEAAMASGTQGVPDPSALAAAKTAWTNAWEPPAEQAVVAATDLAAAVGLSIDAVQAVVDFFTLDLRGASAGAVVDEFTGGGNPLRVRPVLALSGGFMLVHDADLTSAVRERFEQHLKGGSAWEPYAKHRGEVLEQRTHDALLKVLPSAVYREGFEYYVPATAEEEDGPPTAYTKRVEGDHLVVLDDVALIVEDKAVAISPTSREGETRRLRRDLTGIISKAAQQAGRLRDRILKDGGLRVHGEGWVDLSTVREVHTIAVSLEDLMGVSTATADMAVAGLIAADNIPWTVSILDLDLITDLVDHPAEFLLYLRRRRAFMSTVMYTAPDELDLFLHFFSVGLYVEEDPQALRTTYPWMGEVSTAERRRYERQRPVYLTSRTDDLDRWYHAVLAGRTDVQKPSMAASPLRPLIDALRSRGDYAWLSIGATLLSGSAATQEQMSKIPREMLNNPFPDGDRPRSHTIPMLQADAPGDGWLLVWLTRPARLGPAAAERDARDYLRAKKHQLGLARGVVFEYSEATRELVGVWFDDFEGELDDDLRDKARSLRAAEDWIPRQPPQAKQRPGSVPRRKPDGGA